jgi:hypothetical protein
VLRLQSKSLFFRVSSNSLPAHKLLVRCIDRLTVESTLPKPAREFSAGTAELGLAAKSARSGAGIDGLQVQAIRPETAPIC